MHFSMKQERWAALILTLMIGITGAYLGSVRGCAFLSRALPDEDVDHASVRILSLMMEACRTSDTPSWKRLSSVIGAERAKTNSSFRSFGDSCYQVKSCSGIYTRILLASGRVENVCARSHTLIMNYIHCQDGAKQDSPFSR